VHRVARKANLERETRYALQLPGGVTVTWSNSNPTLTAIELAPFLTTLWI
jgi:hypothetical protein